MSHPIVLNGREYLVEPGEYPIRPHAEYNNLTIHDDLALNERIVGLLCDLAEAAGTADLDLVVDEWRGGGFVPIGCCERGLFRNVWVGEMPVGAGAGLPANLAAGFPLDPPFAIFGSSDQTETSYILSTSKVGSGPWHTHSGPWHTHSGPWHLSGTNLYLHVPQHRQEEFYKAFHTYLDVSANVLAYDNLIHLCIMVKDAGPLFERVLRENLPYIDRWTVLDTGSTDGTQEVVRRILGSSKKGRLVEEPFINFRDSRNRCLDLAGTSCKFNLMLDDTYAIRGDLRGFLNTVRGDQFATSFSLLIQSDDLEYYSNRITKSAARLRYKYTLHEVIQEEGNITVVVPKEAAYIYDYRAPYMEKRTMDRKAYDLQCLHDMMREEPTNPRHMYYLAQTYNIIGDVATAAKWFEARATSPLRGFHQEVVDSWFELARLYNFKLNKSWAICEETYMKAYRADPTRPDALYFIGVHYNETGEKAAAYEYFKRAFELGYPIHAQFSLKPTLSNYYLPKFMAPLAYQFAEPAVGLAACQRFASFVATGGGQPDETMASWHAIFQILTTMPAPAKNPIWPSNKPTVVFCVDGGWGPWTGRDILTKGVGGSETWAIEMARGIQVAGIFNCIVFCRCTEPDIFEGVHYRPITEFSTYIAAHNIHTCIISRYSEYIPATFVHGIHIENVYFVMHDVCPTGNVIPLNPRLRAVICLTEWHAGIFKETFPQLADRIEVFSYGITAQGSQLKKVPNSFIYSSFPNRGLLQLLRMWPSIIAAIPDATLNIYADVSGAWVNRVSQDEMAEVKTLLGKGLVGVTLHGWVSKTTLASAWQQADIWLYPATFKETFCLTALEAAASGTLAICPPLAALAETAASGILVPGDASTASWQAAALEALLAIQADPARKARHLASAAAWASGLSWRARTEEFQSKYLRGKPVIAGMYNWTHDVPAGSRATFEAAIAIVSPKHILEIGTYAGTSLIEMLRLYPASRATAIDRWANYEEEGLSTLSSIKERAIEHTFYANIRTAGVADRVAVMKGDSVDMLLQLIEQGARFDFIYVDGSHKCIDCYTDMAIAWRLLHPGGVLAVDDMYYMSGLVENGSAPFAYPLRGIEHFLEREAGTYKVIAKDYRIFLQKLT